MATYTELFDLTSNSDLRNKVAVACTIAAKNFIALASPTNGQLLWAKRALANPLNMADTVYKYVLAANTASTVSSIITAPDSAIQTNVDAAAAKLATIEDLGLSA